MNEAPENQIFDGMNTFYGLGYGPMAHQNGYTIFSLKRYCELSGFEVEKCNEIESRYGKPRGDLLYIGEKIERKRTNLAQWIPHCAWSPFQFRANMKYLNELAPGSSLSIQRKKYSKDILLYEQNDI
ncbi:hypothetical protein ACFL7M_02185 [Thermodesulfobacteriota bacterium]